MTKELTTKYFDGEGRASMKECIHVAFDWCINADIRTLVIFTGTGEGPQYVGKELLSRERYKSLRAVAVTPPAGRPYRSDLSDPNSPLIYAGLSPAIRSELVALGIGVVSAQLPFKERYDGKERTSEWLRVSESFGILGGGFALCVQAVLVACDAGLVEHGEQVVALTADTAVELRACRTESFLSPLEGMLASHVICRPARYNISKQIHEAIAAPAQASSEPRLIETTAHDVAALPPARAESRPEKPPTRKKQVKRAKAKRTRGRSSRG